MNIGHRRYSGPAFLDATNVRSKRGAYLEKRIALYRALVERGNTVTIINNGDDFSVYDLIIVEFGSLNYMFHKKDIDFTNQVLLHKNVVFILDDPDMMPKELYGATVWANAWDLKACQKKWKDKTFEYFPIAGLQPIAEPKKKHNGKVVYYGGTSGGGEKMLMKYKVLIPELEIYGHKKDYKHLQPKEPPTEDERSNFYSDFMACLNVSDSLHKKLGWLTGRKFDAIISGCPTVDELPKMFEIIPQLKDDTNRLALVKWQQENLLSEQKKACELLFKKYNI